jgi:hypothetical protein
MGEDKRRAGDVADTAGTEGDVLEGSPATGGSDRPSRRLGVTAGPPVADAAAGCSCWSPIR